MQEYAQKVMSDGKFEPDSQLKCPVTNCIAMKSVQPQMYKENGGGPVGRMQNALAAAIKDGPEWEEF